MATIRVFLWEQSLFQNGRMLTLNKLSGNLDFKRRLQNIMFFVETTPGTFGLNKQFHLKNHFVAKDTFNNNG